VPVRIEAGLTDPLEAQLAPRERPGLRIGLVVPQSGALGLFGPSAVDAALLATHEVNVAGGLRGAYVDLVLVDGGRSPLQVADEVRRLCLAGAVDALVGFHTSDVHRAVEEVVAGRTPYVFTPPHEGGRRRPGVVCIGADPTRQLRSAVAWLTRQHALRRWALVGNDYIWPWAVHRAARPLVERAGARVVLERFVPLGSVAPRADRLVDDLRRTRADAVLVSLVGRDLVTFHRALRQAGLDRRLVRLSGALEENGLLAGGGDRTGTLYAAMSSFVTMTDERHLGLAERYAAVLGPQAPVLDSYAEGVYDGLHLVASMAASGSLRPERLARATAAAVDVRRTRRVHLARADGLDLTVVPGVA
jgi:ABC-type branched-subunit amino acid transport system substrate-binding protein